MQHKRIEVCVAALYPYQSVYNKPTLEMDYAVICRFSFVIGQIRAVASTDIKLLPVDLDTLAIF